MINSRNFCAISDNFMEPFLILEVRQFYYELLGGRDHIMLFFDGTAEEVFMELTGSLTQGLPFLGACENNVYTNSLTVPASSDFQVML